MQRVLISAALTLAAIAGPAGAHSESTSSKVATSAETIRPLMIGAAVPDVTVQDLDGKAMALRDALAAKPTLLIFYRGGW